MNTHNPAGCASADAPGAAVREVARHELAVPGARLYYQTQGAGPGLVLLGGGPANADTLSPLAACLTRDRTVVTYDRRGYSRSRADDRDAPVGIAGHAADLALLIAALGLGPVSVFGTSFGALIALDLAASSPGSVTSVVVHEPPLGQMLAGDRREEFDLNLTEEPDPGAALDAIAASVGVTRGLGAGGGTRAEAGQADIELFIRRDVPAIAGYHLDLGRLGAVAGRLVVTGSEGGRGFYPYRCAQRLADALGTSLVEMPGHHAGMIQHPAEFAVRLNGLLAPPVP